jgi:hypothetical protein
MCTRFRLSTASVACHLKLQSHTTCGAYKWPGMFKKCPAGPFGLWAGTSPVFTASKGQKLVKQADMQESKMARSCRPRHQTSPAANSTLPLHWKTVSATPQWSDYHSYIQQLLQTMQT